MEHDVTPKDFVTKYSLGKGTIKSITQGITYLLTVEIFQCFKPWGLLFILCISIYFHTTLLCKGWQHYEHGHVICPFGESGELEERLEWPRNFMTPFWCFTRT